MFKTIPDTIVIDAYSDAIEYFFFAILGIAFLVMCYFLKNALE